MEKIAAANGLTPEGAFEKVVTWLVYVILKSVGFGVNAEVQTNEGRIDMTCETATGIWLIEFKLDRPAEEALADR